ncbi:MAG: diguanylate cyclase [Pseudolabrys sp.]|nr:diguanylate cyclase [Pseudolabrys sp.]
MATFLTSQLDFIFFFYGLAFLLFGAVVSAVSRSPNQTIPWPMLGAFAYIHGACEWFDLIALVVSDNPEFALFRTVLMTVSFLALFEFARQDAGRIGIPVPGRWIYLPLVAVTVFGWYLAGVTGANIMARYALAFPASTLVCVLFAIHARRAPPAERRWLIVASVAFGAYGVAAGLVVPPVQNYSFDVINYPLFIEMTGMPVQLIRGLLACLSAFAIWAFWGQRLIVNSESALYAKFHKRQFILTLSAMGTVLVLGWFLTEVMGGIYKTHVQNAARADLNLIASRLTGETATTEAMVQVLAGSRAVGELLANSPAANRERVDDLLTLETQASGASEGFILDRNGIVLAATARASADRIATIGRDLSLAPYFRSAVAGNPGHHYAFDAASRMPHYFVSYPIRNEKGVLLGAGVLKKTLAQFEAEMAGFQRSFAMIDAEGIVILTNRPDMRLRMIWPLSATTRAALSPFYGELTGAPLMAREFVGAQWGTFDGNRDYIQRHGIDHGSWSLVTWNIPQGVFASRVVGIVITLLMTIMILIYLVARDRWMYDNVQLEKRFELEELARSLDKRAATDPLTGLFNRRKLDRSLTAEIMRAERYKTPLALMLFDIDHFKRVNDNFGHQVGDAVLIELSRYAAAHIRSTDVLARWGGEEFVILCPGISGPMTCLLAGNLLAGMSSLKMPEVGSITCSFGVTEYQEGDTAEALLMRADNALYRAKSNGRNRIELETLPNVESPGTAPSAGGPFETTKTPVRT